MPACTCGSVRMYRVPLFCLSFSLFESLVPINSELCRALLTHLLLYVDALQTFTWQKRRGQTGGPPTEERCVYICDYRFDLSPYAGPFVVQTKGGTLQILWRFTTHLSRVKRAAVDSSQSTLLPRRSHVSH